jgi:hypothetical protein
MARYEILIEGEAEAIAAKLEEALTVEKVSLSELARRAGVSQPMAHGVKNARVMLRTPNLRKLELYIHMVLGQQNDVSQALDSEIRGFLRAGGQLEELRAIIAACTAARSTW